MQIGTGWKEDTDIPLGGIEGGILDGTSIVRYTVAHSTKEPHVING